MTTTKTQIRPPEPWDGLAPRDSRIAGVLVGMAVGDALGSPYELNGRKSYGNAQFGRGTFGFRPAEYTDDTQQAVLVCQARSDPAVLAAFLIEWAKVAQDVGAQTRAILSRVRSYHGMVLAARAYARRPPRGSDPGSGNGGLMRTSPVCLPFLGDRVKVAQAARQVSALTHATEWDQDAAMVWSLLVEAAMTRDGEPFDLSAAVADALGFVAPERREPFAALAEVAMKVASPVKFQANGSCFMAFAAALWSVAHASSYEQTVQQAIQIGGDADTVAAIAGGLAGAIYGVQAIPARWYSKVWGWPGMNARSLAALALEAAGSTRELAAP